MTPSPEGPRAPQPESRPTKPAGRWVAVEGGDGTGKTAQVRHLAAALRAHGALVVETREPGGTSVGAAIREYVLADANATMAPEVQAIFFEADRAATVRSVVEPALAEGAWVVSDRGPHGTTVYQGYVQGVPLDVLATLTAWATRGRAPDLTVILDVGPETTRARLRGRPGKLTWFDRWGDDRARAVREAYRRIAREHAHACVLVSAEDGETEVADRVWRAVRTRWPAEFTSAASGGGRRPPLFDANVRPD